MIRTRFAPSPTGYLHIGGVRTALFNWLFTRRHGGQFVLRIDDTDAVRNRPEALKPILEGFRWLGINWDEGPEVGGSCAPYFQAQRQSLYTDAALRLLETGHAYPCYRTKEELEAERKDAEKAKKSYVHRGEHRNTRPAECVRLHKERATVIRLKAPEDYTVVVDDLICGKVEVRTDVIGDAVILRADGRALYNFATVVDDAAMNITHVIRAKEHLSNTPVQVLAYQALGYPVPKFAHVPVVNAPKSKDKLSKRKMKQFMTPEVIAQLRAVHAVPTEASDEEIKNREDLNPATVAFYQALGYLPAALVNYFGRLGWSLDDKAEIIPLDQMIANFGLERVNASPASFDPEKLLWLAGEYMRMLPLVDKVNGVIPFLRRAGLVGDTIDEATRSKIRQVVDACGDRLKIYTDVLQYGAFFFRDPVYDPQAVQKRLKKEGAPQLLRDMEGLLQGADPFTATQLESRIKDFCEKNGVKLGDVNHVLRVATTGVMIGPGVFESLAILGKEEVLTRVKTAKGI
ncbi:MAG: glutamate--tRNA ligase [Planctomycetes bacterium]|nr:glutamate--tRNA ligase [Planctomycetota bacterium]